MISISISHLEEKDMKLLELPGGDKLHHYQKSLVLCFAGPRDVLSTGPIGGGFRTDLQEIGRAHV